MDRRPVVWSVVAVTAGVAVSPLLELATGQELLYNLALTGLIAIFWFIFRYTWKEMGVARGERNAYLISLLYPVVLMAVVVAAAALAGRISFEGEALGKSIGLAALMFISTIIAALITEEGFFRGTLWAVLRQAQAGSGWTILISGAAFGLWHLPVAIIEPNFALPASVIPVYVINAALLGVAWGALRLGSGSVIVPSVCHGMWNTLAYTLFGYGQKAGLLGVKSYHLFGPERGYAGLILNLAAALILTRWAFRATGHGEKPLTL